MKKISQGFTLIELLASMALLVVIILLTTQIFTQTTNSWKTGSSKTRSADLGRNAMGIMQRDGSVGVIDDIFPLFCHSDHLINSANIADSSALYFVAHVARRVGIIQQDFHEICYFVKEDNRGRGALMRRSYERGINSYTNTTTRSGQTWYAGTIAGLMGMMRDMTNDLADCEVIADNVYQFRVNCYTNDTAGTSYSKSDYYSKNAGHKAPRYVEVELLVLSDEQWARTNLTSIPGWSGEPFDDFAESNATRYTSTLSFPLCER